MDNAVLGNVQSKKLRKITWLFVLYAAVTTAIYILPYTKLVFPYIGVALLMLASLPLLMIKKNNWLRYGVALTIFTVLMMFLCLFNGVSYVAAINDAIRNVRFFLPVLWGCFAVEYCTPKQQKVLFISFVAVTGFIVYKTLAALEIEPMIARILAQEQSHSEPEINAFRLDNVGGYGFSYMLGVVTICMANSIFVLQKKWQKIIAIAGTVLCFYFIIKSMYTTLLLLSSISVLLVILFRVEKLPTKIMVVVAFVVLFFSIAPLFQFISQVFQGTLLSAKFSQMYRALTGGGTEALGLRPQLLEQALTNWLQTPLLGGNYNTPSHSLLLELLQQNGIVGFIAWTSFFGASGYIIIKTLREHNADTVVFKLCYAYMLVLSFFNDTRYTFEITLALFFMVPVYCDVFKRKSTESGW